MVLQTLQTKILGVTFIWAMFVTWLAALHPHVLFG